MHTASSTSEPCSLRPLSVRQIVPSKVSQYGHALAALRTVDSVRVVRNPDQSSDSKYLVLAYSNKKTHSRIPVAIAGSIIEGANSSLPLPNEPARERAPVCSLTKPLAAFSTLREQVTDIIYASHQTTLCAYCKKTMTYVLWGNLPPSSLQRIMSAGDDKELLDSLARFLVELMPLVVSGRPSPSDHRCLSRARILLVVHAFLFN